MLFVTLYKCCPLLILVHIVDDSYMSWIDWADISCSLQSAKWVQIVPWVCVWMCVYLFGTSCCLHDLSQTVLEYSCKLLLKILSHDDVIKWKHFPRYWPFVRCAGNSPATGEFPTQRPVTRSFDVFFDLRLINGWVNNGEAGDLRRHRAQYIVTIMLLAFFQVSNTEWLVSHMNSS